MFETFLKPKTKAAKISHVVITDCENDNYDITIHLWNGDDLNNGHSTRLTTTQAIKLKEALMDRYGV